jgi:hypothetical protein
MIMISRHIMTEKSRQSELRQKAFLWRFEEAWALNVCRRKEISLFEEKSNYSPGSQFNMSQEHLACKD